MIEKPQSGDRALPPILCHPPSQLRMSTIRVGSNEKYAEGWEKAFGGGKKSAKKKVAPKKKASKTSAKKKPAKKKSTKRR